MDSSNTIQSATVSESVTTTDDVLNVDVNDDEKYLITSNETPEMWEKAGEYYKNKQTCNATIIDIKKDAFIVLLTEIGLSAYLPRGHLLLPFNSVLFKVV